MAIAFTREELSTLKLLQRNTSDRDTYQKLTTLIMLNNNLSQEFIAEMLGVDRTTINRHYNSYKQAKNFEQYLAIHYKPCMGKLSPEQLESVKAYVSENLCSTSLQVSNFIAINFNVQYSESGIIALLHRINFVYKKTKLIPSKANVALQEAFVEEFRKLEKALSEEDVILFADGVHPQHNTESSYAWIAKGKEKEILSNTGRVRVNINGAINPQNPTEVVAYECETIDAVTSVEFLKQIEKRYEDKNCIHLFVDNARYYRSKLVQQYIGTSKIKMHFLPPYSPNLNPIERLWKFLKKTVIKSNYTPEPEIFKEKIKDFFNNIEQYKSKLETLINTNFHIIKPLSVLSQT
jgi:transposase